MTLRTEVPLCNHGKAQCECVPVRRGLLLRCKCAAISCRQQLEPNWFYMHLHVQWLFGNGKLNTVSIKVVSWVFFKRCHLSKKYKIGRNGWHVSRWKQDCFDLSWAQMTRVRSFTENNIPCIAQKQHLSNNLTLEPSHSSTLLILWNQYGSCVLHVCRNPEQFYALCF